ncbi:hypothetical protein EfmAA242_35430 (plasmid) [Enterococcus faecium]|nr:hypothetical protein EfmAA242_35430 [Enterococcus faecium]
MKLLQCREGKVSKIKKELEKAGLLKQKRGRVNKRDGKIESMPNLLYLGKPILMIIYSSYSQLKN